MNRCRRLTAALSVATGLLCYHLPGAARADLNQLDTAAFQAGVCADRTDKLLESHCFQFLRSALGGMSVAASMANFQLPFCVLDSVSYDRIRTSFVAYMSARPKFGKESAVAMLNEALKQDYPCS